MGQLMAKQPFIDINSIDLGDTKSFEIDLGRGVLKSDGVEDHQRMMEALAVMKEVRSFQPAPTQATQVDQQSSKQHGLTLPQVVDKLLLLKKDYSESTKLSYKNGANEFSNYLKHLN